GDWVRVECYLPAGLPVPPAGEDLFRIDRVMHIYRDFLRDAGLREESCHNDVTCYPAWNIPKLATGMIVLCDSSSCGQCSGELINDLNGDFTPYFLLAGHCGGSAVQAQNSQIWWKFQTAVCNSGSPPPMSGVPTSLVCTSLSSHLDTRDFT